MDENGQKMAIIISNGNLLQGFLMSGLYFLHRLITNVKQFEFLNSPLLLIQLLS